MSSRSAVASQPHRGLALRDAPGRHDADAVVVGGAALAAAVFRDDGADLGDHLEAAVVLGELETVGLDGDGLRYGEDALLHRRPRAVALGLGGGEHATFGEESPC